MYEKMIALAFQARKKAYAPYSKFQVGACLQTETGEFFSGCNIENASYSVTNCAERTAFFKAVSQGYQKFQRIAVVGGFSENRKDYYPPCGVCLQVMAEFCQPDAFEIILAKSEEKYQVYLLKDLLPKGFALKDL